MDYLDEVFQVDEKTTKMLEGINLASRALMQKWLAARSVMPFQVELPELTGFFGDSTYLVRAHVEQVLGARPAAAFVSVFSKLDTGNGHGSQTAAMHFPIDLYK